MTTTPPHLERVTINLTRRAIAARSAIQLRTGENQTDIINRAIAVYAVVLELMHRDGTDHLTVVQPDGTKERVHLL